jgi:hypothetical protein
MVPVASGQYLTREAAWLQGESGQRAGFNPVNRPEGHLAVSRGYADRARA